MFTLLLSLKSLANRRLTAALTILAIAVSVTLLLGVERIRNGARSTFESTISGTDLIVGARTGDLQLLLYSVFRIGSAPNPVSWSTYQAIAAQPDIAWTIPIALGDSHRGFRVMGTSLDYFNYFRYGRRLPLEFAQGGPFADVFDTVLGWNVAEELGYAIGQEIILSHGVTDATQTAHENKPFRVVGILRRTGTPVDRTVHISLAGIEALHVDWQRGRPPAPGEAIPAEEVRKMDLTPKMITAFLVGLKSKFGLFTVRRQLSEYQAEPLSAILPGVTLADLWRTVQVGETALRVISVFVVASGLIGMLTAILTTLNERRREMAILRSVGARPRHIFGLLVSEAGYLSLFGCLGGVVLLYVGLVVAQPLIESRFGLYLPIEMPSLYDLAVIAVVVGAGMAAGLLPAWRAYRNSLADGLTIRL